MLLFTFLMLFTDSLNVVSASLSIFTGRSTMNPQSTFSILNGGADLPSTTFWRDLCDSTLPLWIASLGSGSLEPDYAESLLSYTKWGCLRSARPAHHDSLQYLRERPNNCTFYASLLSCRWTGKLYRKFERWLFLILLFFSIHNHHHLFFALWLHVFCL